MHYDLAVFTFVPILLIRFLTQFFFVYYALPYFAYCDFGPIVRLNGVSCSATWHFSLDFKSLPIWCPPIGPYNWKMIYISQRQETKNVLILFTFCCEWHIWCFSCENLLGQNMGSLLHQDMLSCVYTILFFTLYSCLLPKMFSFIFLLWWLNVCRCP